HRDLHSQLRRQRQMCIRDSQIIMTITYLSSFLASSTKVRAISNKKVAGTIMQSSLLKQASINDNYE
ncbi:hypothetical protein KQJ29_18815, partial [Enterococcus sp. S181_ASV_20]|nr:hypothetical protein [Enterococcus sp. S181_ASV_20]